VDSAEQVAKALQEKLSKLVLDELLRFNPDDDSKEGNQQNQNSNANTKFKLAEKIVHNLQVTIRNVHMRYEHVVEGL